MPPSIMPPFAELQDCFAAAIRDAGGGLPQPVTSHTARHPLKRFNVYRNNVYVSLIEVLQGRFPAVTRLVGEEFFRAMARVYVEQEPPRSPMMLYYGEGFPAFLETFGPVRDTPYLADVARIEAAWNRAYHAADSQPAAAEALAAIAPGRLPGVIFELHPSLGLVTSPYPALSIWETNTADAEVKPIGLEQGGGEDAMIVRPELTVNVHRLPPGAFAFIRMLANGAGLGEAYEAQLTQTPQFDLQLNLAGLIHNGAISGFLCKNEG